MLENFTFDVCKMFERLCIFKFFKWPQILCIGIHVMEPYFSFKTESVRFITIELCIKIKWVVLKISLISNYYFCVILQVFFGQNDENAWKIIIKSAPFATYPQPLYIQFKFPSKQKSIIEKLLFLPFRKNYERNMHKTSCPINFVTLLLFQVQLHITYSEIFVEISKSIPNETFKFATIIYHRYKDTMERN